MRRYLAVRAAAPVFGRLPAVSYRLATPVGWAAWKLMPRLRRRVIRTQLPLCGGDRHRARREGLKAVRNVAHYWVDLATLMYRDTSRIEGERLRIVNIERLDAETAGPTVILSAHSGNPELCVQILVARGRPFLALVEELQPPALNRYMIRMRSAGGGRFVEADFRGARAALRLLREGGIVAVLGDRDLAGTGICVPFFGQQVKLPRGPWELARRAGVRVLPVFTRRERLDYHTAIVHEPIEVPRTNDADADIEQAMRKFAALLEEFLAQEPGQWGVLEDYWQVHRCG
jgi:lauroyl/myristoyl acyltransferase